MRTFTRCGSVLTVLLLLAVIANSGCTRAVKRTVHLSRANRYYDSGELDKAEIEYLIVLRNDPGNAQAIGRLGLIYYDEGRVGHSVPYLEKGSELKPDDLELRLKLAGVYMTAGKWKEARDEANFVLDRNPRDAEAPMLLAESAVATNAIDEVEQRLKAVSQKSGETAALDVAIGSLDLRRKDTVSAEAAFQRAKTLDPKSGATYWALGNLYFLQNDQKRAEEAFKTAAELSPLRSPRRLRYAQFKIQSGDLAEAKRFLQEMTQKTPDYLPAWNWLAEIALREKKYDECADKIGRILARDSLNYDALSLNAQLMLAKGQTDKAIAEFKKVATAYPQVASAHYQLAMAYMAGNDLGQATISLNQALSLAPDFPEAVMLLAVIKMKTGETGAAVVSLKGLVEKHPRLVEAQFALADAYRAEANFDAAIGVYRKLQEMFPKSPEVPFSVGVTFRQMDKREEARQAFAKVLELSPDSLGAYEQLVAMDVADKQYAAALQRTQTLIDRRPKLAGPRLLQAQIYLAEHDTTRAEAASLKALELEPGSQVAYLMLAQVYVDTKQDQKALDALQRDLQANPFDTGALMRIGEIEEQQKDYTAARDTYEKLLAIAPQSAQAMNNLACLYSERFGQIDKAYALATKARELRPYDSNVADTLGWVLYRMKQYPRALTLLQESANKQSDVADVQFHLGMAQYMMGDEEPARASFQRALQLNKDLADRDEANKCLAVLSIAVTTAGREARATLEKRLAERPDDPVALARMAALYEREGSFDKANEAYQAIVKTSPENVRALLALARLYSGRFTNLPKAVEFARIAYKVAPDDPGVSAALGRLAYQAGDYKWALGLLQQASRQQPQDAALQYDLALALYSVGQVPEAGAAARAALNAGAGFTRADDAIRFLDMITLAGDPVQAAASSNRVQDILKLQPDYVPALMVMGAIEDQTPDIHAAERVYEKALSLYPDFAPAKRRLAILYAADQPADDQKALQLAMQAREAFAEDPDVAKALGILAYRQGDYARSSRLLQESAGKLSGDPKVFYYLGMDQYQLKQQADSKRSLQHALDLSLRGELANEARRTLAEVGTAR
jgi:tetratricopeptide (TPR) repeat protein